MKESKAIDGPQGQNKKFVLNDVEVQWQPVEMCEELDHMVRVARERNDFSRGSRCESKKDKGEVT